jgi:hypothetical protein
MNKGVLAVLLGVVLAIGFAMSAADRAEALTLYIPANGFVVPYVIADSETGLDTAVGITVIPQASFPINIKWTFFTECSTHVMDDELCLTAGMQYGFFWSQVMGAGLDGTRGYLVFNNATTEDSWVTANAFLIKGMDIAAFIPILPLNADDISFVGERGPCYVASFQLNPLNPIVSAQYGIQQGDDVLLRYAIAGLESRIVCWFISNPGAYPIVDIYDDFENNVSISISLPCEISFIDPSVDILGRPYRFVDGFIHNGYNRDKWPADGIRFTLVGNGDPLDLGPMPTDIQTLIATHYLYSVTAP